MPDPVSNPHGHVFISYARGLHDDQVDLLQRSLEGAGAQVWRDTHMLWPGEDWRSKIQKAITNDALVFVACFSRESVARSKAYQNEEIQLAVDQMRLRRPDEPWLIPVRLDDCDIPEIRIGSERTLRSIQWADLFGSGSAENQERLVQTVLRVLADQAGKPREQNPQAGVPTIDPGPADPPPDVPPSPRWKKLRLIQAAILSIVVAATAASVALALNHNSPSRMLSATGTFSYPSAGEQGLPGPETLRARGTVQHLQAGHHLMVFLRAGTQRTWWAGDLDVTVSPQGRWSGTICLGFGGVFTVYLVDLGPAGLARLEANSGALWGSAGMPFPPNRLASDVSVLSSVSADASGKRSHCGK